MCVGCVYVVMSALSECVRVCVHVMCMKGCVFMFE